VIGVIGCIRHNDIGGQPLDQRPGLRRIARLSGGEEETNRTANSADRKVDFGARPPRECPMA
jgi:hypothetical protein